MPDLLATARALLLLAAITLLTGACGRAASATPERPEDDALSSCRSGVTHANLHVNDVTALDFAIHDCTSLAMLASELAANPGYLDADLSARAFATNRCQDPAFLDVANALVCQELGLP